MFFPTRSEEFQLSTSSWPPSRSPSGGTNRGCIPKRAMRCLLLLAMFGVASTWYTVNNQLPPLYEEYRQREDNLPHSNGQHTKYIFFANHQRGVGWGNVMQELLLNALLAYAAKRSFVFYNYEWSTKFRYTLYKSHLIPSTIPLSATLSGPLVGGPILPQDVPRAVSENFFLSICPNRTIIRSEELRVHLQGATALQVLDAWTQKLRSMEDRCIEIPRGSWSIFDFILFGSKDVLDIWPRLSQSPMITQFDWSSLIYSAFNSNRDLFEPPLALHTGFSDTAGSSALSPLLRRLPGLLVMHIRHGDFVNHCDKLARFSAGFNGFNQFEGLPDKLDIPPGGGWGENTLENFAIYRRRCFPSIPQVMSKVSEVKRKVSGLDRVYIMTNAKREWVDELTQALQQTTGPEKWNTIWSTRDLALTWEQKFVSHALDMLVAQRAQSFIGNGWSSLTSNIVTLRMGGKHAPNTTFFW